VTSAAAVVYLRRLIRWDLIMDSLTPASGLGNLAQSARTKQLKTARGILFFVGILTVIANAALVWFAQAVVDSQIEAELKTLRAQQMVIDQAAVDEFREQAVRTTRLVNGIAVFIGFLFIVGAVKVYSYPVPVTVTSLILYIGCWAVFGVLDPTTLARGWIIKLLVAAGLFKAVQAALAYESERKAAAQEELPAETPAAAV
jgi:hypothetical protein